MITTLGTIDLALCDNVAPITVANFLRYAGSGYYSNFTSQGETAVSFISRSVPGFVIQGGGYAYSDFRTSKTFIANYVGYSRVPKAAPIQNEFSRSNLRGTIAMAKLPGNPNSATSEWFINLADNGGVPPNGLDFQNGGFTVFGNIIDPGMTLVDTIASLSFLNESGFDILGNPINYPQLNQSPLPTSPFCSTPCSLPMAGLNTVPVNNYKPTTGLDPSNLISVIKIPNVISTPTIQGNLMTFTADVDMTFLPGSAQTANSDDSKLLLATFTPPPNKTVQFNDGIFKFSMTGVMGPSGRIVTLHNDDPPTANHYYAYGPTPDNPTLHWFDFTFDGTTGAEFIGNKILLHFVDNQRGDNDSTVNSIIHVGAPVVQADVPSSNSASGCTIAAIPTQTTNNGDWVLISMFLAFVALVRRRARRDRIQRATNIASP